MGFHIIGFFLLICFVQFGQGVVTYDPQYLPPLEIGRQKEVVLPCDYDIGDSEIGQLDLKWYFNNEITPFLQWVPGGGRRPQLIEPTPFVGHVDLDYKSWPNDENKAYKDLKIQDPTPGLSGKYTCKVSTFENEGLVEQQLNIFVPPKRLILDHHFNNSLRILNFSCEVEQVFPKPNINIILNKSPLSYEEYLIESDEFEFNGLYDINLQLQEIEVNESKIINLGCEVEFPAPFDFKMVEEVEIELLEIVPPEEEKIEIPCDSEEDGLFCSQEILDGSGDYDNDWLNIYNESTPGNCEEPNCDRTSGDDTPGVAFSPSMPIPAIAQLFGICTIYWKYFVN